MGGSTDNNDQERRFYLKEMEIVLRIMVTGGSGQELTQPQVARLQQALIRGLQLSVDEGEPHARPIHIARAMLAMAEEEAKKEGGLKDIALDMRNMADALTSWTVGANGILFNQTATGFDESYDLTVIELGRSAARETRACWRLPACRLFTRSLPLQRNFRAAAVPSK